MTLFEAHSFGALSAPYSYHLNLSRLAVLTVALWYFRSYLTTKLYLTVAWIPIVFVLIVGAILPTMRWELVALDASFVLWSLLQLQTILFEHMLFFLILPYLLRTQNSIIIVALFAIAHGLTIMTPFIAVAGFIYYESFKRYSFTTSIMMHFILNFTHILFFTYPYAQ